MHFRMLSTRLKNSSPIIKKNQTQIFRKSRFEIKQKPNRCIIQNYFRHTLAESATFPPCSETGMQCFRPGYGEKQYTHHGNKIGQPTARVCHPSRRLLQQLKILLSQSFLQEEAIIFDFHILFFIFFNRLNILRLGRPKYGLIGNFDLS